MKKTALYLAAALLSMSAGPLWAQAKGLCDEPLTEDSFKGVSPGNQIRFPVGNDRWDRAKYKCDGFVWNFAHYSLGLYNEKWVGNEEAAWKFIGSTGKLRTLGEQVAILKWIDSRMLGFVQKKTDEIFAIGDGIVAAEAELKKEAKKPEDYDRKIKALELLLDDEGTKGNTAVVAAGYSGPGVIAEGTPLMFHLKIKQLGIHLNNLCDTLKAKDDPIIKDLRTINADLCAERKHEPGDDPMVRVKEIDSIALSETPEYGPDYKNKSLMTVFNTPSGRLHSHDKVEISRRNALRQLYIEVGSAVGKAQAYVRGEKGGGTVAKKIGELEQLKAALKPAAKKEAKKPEEKGEEEHPAAHHEQAGGQAASVTARLRQQTLDQAGLAKFWDNSTGKMIGEPTPEQKEQIGAIMAGKVVETRVEAEGEGKAAVSREFVFTKPKAKEATRVPVGVGGVADDAAITAAALKVKELLLQGDPAAAQIQAVKDALPGQPAGTTEKDLKEGVEETMGSLAGMAIAPWGKYDGPDKKLKEIGEKANKDQEERKAAEEKASAELDRIDKIYYARLDALSGMDAATAAPLKRKLEAEYGFGSEEGVKPVVPMGTKRKAVYDGLVAKKKELGGKTHAQVVSDSVAQSNESITKLFKGADGFGEARKAFLDEKHLPVPTGSDGYATDEGRQNQEVNEALDASWGARVDKYKDGPESRILVDKYIKDYKASLADGSVERPDAVAPWLEAFRKDIKGAPVDESKKPKRRDTSVDNARE